MEIEVRLLDFQVSCLSFCVRLQVLVSPSAQREPVVPYWFPSLGCFEVGGWVGWW